MSDCRCGARIDSAGRADAGICDAGEIAGEGGERSLVARNILTPQLRIGGKKERGRIVTGTGNKEFREGDGRCGRRTKRTMIADAVIVMVITREPC